MDTNWAAEHLQTIRTLMERSALYRRALAPMMLLTGLLGVLAALAGWQLRVESPRGFVGLWMATGGLAIVGAFLLVRRQALKDAEPVWSPPARRVMAALLPAWLAGLGFGLTVALAGYEAVWGPWWLLPVWMALYGCALHAAGFFMPRGVKLFGGGFVLAGILLFLALSLAGGVPPLEYAHALMGFCFGGGHLAYGVYLYFTEKTGQTA